MDPYLGMIMMWPCSRLPINWMVCAGQSLSTSQYAALFSVIGYTYGGSNSTFNLPNLVGRVPIGAGQGPTLSSYPLGTKSGAETVALTTAQVPPHTHSVVTTGAKLSVMEGSGLYVSASPATMAIPNSPANVVAAGASDFDNGSGTIEVYNFGAATNTVQLTGTLNLVASTSPGSVSPNSGGLGHNNIQPTMGVNYVICVQGVFPPNPNS